MKFRISAAVAAGLLTVYATPAQAADDYTWFGGAGTWSIGSNWSPAHVPNSSTNDNALITAGTVTVDGAFSIHNLSVSAGTLQGSGTLDVYSTGNFTGASTKSLSGFTFNNHGNLFWTEGTLQPIGSNFKFNNLAGATFEVSAASAVVSQTGIGFATMAFSNAGWLHSSVLGTSEWVDATVTNTGTIDVAFGTLAIYRGSSSGRVNVESSNTLVLGNFDFNTGSTFSGGGQVIVGAGTTPSGTVKFDSDMLLNRSTFKGTAITGAGRLRVNELYWQAGSLLGSGTIQIGAFNAMYADLAPTGTAQFFRNIDILTNGRIEWNSSASIETGGGAILTNAGTLNFKADATLARPQLGNGPAMTVNNAGSIIKSAGTGEALVEAVVNNTGTIVVSNGTLTLGWGGTSESGSQLDISASTELRFAGPAFWIKSGTGVAGSGAIRNNGSLRSPAAVLANRTTMAGLELAIDGNLDTDQFNWISGVISGSGTTKLIANKTFNADWGVMAGRTLDTNGKSITWTGGAFNSIGTSAFGLSGTGTINSSGTFGISVPSAPLLYLGNINNPAGLVFKNSGHFKLDGATDLHILGPIDSTSVIASNGGTITFDGGGSATGGSLALTSGSTFVFPADFTFGDVDIVGSAGTVIFSNPGTINVGSFASLSTRVQVDEGTVNFAASGMTVPILRVGDGLAIINTASAVATTINNDGALRIAAGATLSGTSYSQTGSLVLDGGTISTSTAMSLPGGSLLGHGTIAADLTTEAAVLSPGEGDGDIGLIHITGDVAIDEVSASVIDINATTLAHDFMDIDGSVNLGSSLLFITMVGSPSLIPPGQSFEILHADGGTSGVVAFTDLFSPGRIDVYDALNPTDPIGSFRLTDTGTALILDQFQVPEPSVLSILAIGVLVRRRRK